MGSAGFILGGALQGIGAGLVQQNQVKREDEQVARQAEQASATQRFQAYLAQRKIEADDARAAQGHQWDMERDKAQAGLKIEATKTDAQLTAERDARLHGNNVSMEQIKTSNEAHLARIKSSLNMTETQAKIAADLAADVQKMGKEIGHEEVTADGRMILYSKTGEVLRASAPGTFNPRGANEDGGDLLGGRGKAPAVAPRPAAPQAAAPAPAPARKPLVNRPSLDDIFGGPQPASPITGTLNSTFSR